MRALDEIVFLPPSPLDHREILVPIDGSELAARTLPLAERLATDIGARVVTVRVPSANDPAEGIVAQARGWPPRLVCMSSHGRGRLVGVVGSVAERVIRSLDRPVILTGPSFEPIQYERIRHLVLTVDGSRLSERMIPVTISWARALSVPVDVVHVDHGEPTDDLAAVLRRDDIVDETYPDMIAEHVRSAGIIAWGQQLRDRDPARAIVQLVERNPDALIVMATHGRSGISRMVMGSVAMRVVGSSPAPLLIASPRQPPPTPA